MKSKYIIHLFDEIQNGQGNSDVSGYSDGWKRTNYIEAFLKILIEGK